MVEGNGGSAWCAEWPERVHKSRRSVYRGPGGLDSGEAERREFLVEWLEGRTSGAWQLRFCTFDRLKRPLRLPSWLSG